MKQLFIAEAKTKSPFGFKSTTDHATLFNIAKTYGDMVAIHTESDWGGSLNKLRGCRNGTSKYILAKGLHKTQRDIDNALSCGGDYVLTVGVSALHDKEFVLTNCDEIFFEPLNLNELVTFGRYFKFVVWNQRDLMTGKKKKETFAQARKLCYGKLIQASFIKTMKDVHPDADGFIVGEHLETFVKSL